MLRIGILLCALAGTALAEDAIRRLEVTVDVTLEVEVGNLVGFRCDQPKLLDAKLTTRAARPNTARPNDARGEVNVFVVKGVSAGTTQCRIGGDLGAFQLFDVVVHEQPKRR